MQIFHGSSTAITEFCRVSEKRLRSSFSRPGAGRDSALSEHVDEAIERLLESEPEPEALKRIELGANHEEQHQELLLTDILHAFFTNPLRPAYRQVSREAGAEASHSPRIEMRGPWAPGHRDPPRFVEFAGGLVRCRVFAATGFCFDNELPRHRVWLEPYALANRLVTSGEFAEFMADGGYRKPELWLSAGWDAVKQNGWRAPLYWTARGRELEAVYSARRESVEEAEDCAGEPGELLRGRRLCPLGRQAPADRV